MTPKRVCITFLDYEDEKGRQSLSSLELVVRLVERELLTNPAHTDVNCMYVEWKEQGKIFWQEEMRDLELMIQLKVLDNKKYLGSISFPFKDLFDQFEQLQQWFTVFDALDDDIFDGNLGEDDAENPRVLVAFEVGEDEDITETELTMTQQDDNSGIIQHQKAKSESRRVLESNKEKRDSDRDVKLTTGSVHHRSSGNPSHLAPPKEHNYLKQTDVQSPRNPPTPPTYAPQEAREAAQKPSKDPKRESMKKPQPVKDNPQHHQTNIDHEKKEAERGRHIDGYTEQRRSDTKLAPGRSSSPNVTPYQNPVPPLPLANLPTNSAQPQKSSAPISAHPLSGSLSYPSTQRLAELEMLLLAKDLDLDK
jgi:hypothetical protein